MSIVHWIISAALSSYAALALQLFAHEAGHALAALASGMEILEFRLGDRFASVGRGRISLSPLLIGGEVRVSTASFKSCMGWQRCLFFAAGPLANLLVSLMAGALVPNAFGLLLVVSGLSVALGTLIPFEGSDGNLLVQQIRNADQA